MTAERIETLCYAVRWRVLLKYLGMLGVVLAALNSVPFAVAALPGEFAATGRYAMEKLARLSASSGRKSPFPCPGSHPGEKVCAMRIRTALVYAESIRSSATRQPSRRRGSL